MSGPTTLLVGKKICSADNGAQKEIVTTMQLSCGVRSLACVSGTRVQIKCASYYALSLCLSHEGYTCISNVTNLLENNASTHLTAVERKVQHSKEHGWWQSFWYHLYSNASCFERWKFTICSIPHVWIETWSARGDCRETDQSSAGKFCAIGPAVPFGQANCGCAPSVTCLEKHLTVTISRPWLSVGAENNQHICYIKARCSMLREQYH